MRLGQVGSSIILAVGLVILQGCSEEKKAATNEAAPPAPAKAVVKGGDARNGEYDAAPNWWKAAADHKDGWTWGEVSGIVADTPDRIVVVIWGDRKAENHREQRPDGSNYLVVVNRNGDIVETVTKWDKILNKPHQVYISPYDPERHVWIVERGGGRGSIWKS